MRSDGGSCIHTQSNPQEISTEERLDFAEAGNRSLTVHPTIRFVTMLVGSARTLVALIFVGLAAGDVFNVKGECVG